MYDVPSSLLCPVSVHLFVSPLQLVVDVPAGQWRDYSIQLPMRTSMIFMLGGTYSPSSGHAIQMDDLCVRSGQCGTVVQSGCVVSHPYGKTLLKLNVKKTPVASPVKG